MSKRIQQKIPVPTQNETNRQQRAAEKERLRLLVKNNFSENDFKYVWFPDIRKPGSDGYMYWTDHEGFTYGGLPEQQELMDEVLLEKIVAAAGYIVKKLDQGVFEGNIRILWFKRIDRRPIVRQ